MYLWACSQVIFSKESSLLLFTWSKIAHRKCIFMCKNSNVVFHLQLAKTWMSPKKSNFVRHAVQSRVSFMDAKEQEKRSTAQPGLWSTGQVCFCSYNVSQSDGMGMDKLFFIAQLRGIHWHWATCTVRSEHPYDKPAVHGKFSLFP